MNTEELVNKFLDTHGEKLFTLYFKNGGIIVKRFGFLSFGYYGYGAGLEQTEAFDLVFLNGALDFLTILDEQASNNVVDWLIARRDETIIRKEHKDL